MSINDRSSWPTAETNPLIALLACPDKWIDGHALALALDPANASRRRSLAAHWPDFDTVIGAETTLRQGEQLVPWKRGGRGVRRVYSKKALVLIAIRAQTPNAAAFRDWLAEHAASILGARSSVGQSPRKNISTSR